MRKIVWIIIIASMLTLCGCFDFLYKIKDAAAGECIKSKATKIYMAVYQGKVVYKFYQSSYWSDFFTDLAAAKLGADKEDMKNDLVYRSCLSTKEYRKEQDFLNDDKNWTEVKR